MITKHRTPTGNLTMSESDFSSPMDLGGLRPNEGKGDKGVLQSKKRKTILQAGGFTPTPEPDGARNEASQRHELQGQQVIHGGKKGRQ